MKSKKILKSTQALFLALAIVTALFAAPLMGVSAAESNSSSTAHSQPGNGQVYVYKAGDATSDARWGNNNLFNYVTVKVGKTYTFSALWRAGSNDKTNVVIGDKVIINGCYNMLGGAKYDPYTGRISYTFTADSDTVTINLENRGNDIQEKNYSFADPKIVETDSNGNPVQNGDIADCDVDFCSDVWKMNISWHEAAWNRDSYVSVGDISAFATKEKPHGQDEVEDGDVWVLSYAQAWNKTAVSYTADVVSGKRYTFSILWKDLGNSATVIRINVADSKGTNILEGGYNTVNGATFDPSTGRLSYTFVAESANATIVFDNRDYGGEYNKNYAIADPQMYESDENGNAIPNGDTVDCDVDFCYDKWIITNQSYAVVEEDDNLTVAGGYSSDFKLRKSHAQPGGENKVYALSYRYSYDQKQVTISPFVFKDKTYTFSMLYKVYGYTTTRISVNGTQILNGDYNVQNGATYDPYTGRIYYTFKADASKVEIVLDNLGNNNSEKYHSYDIADPQLIETDNSGNAVENGDTADCDVDFCEWRVWNWNTSYNPLDARTEISKSDFSLRQQPHTQPADGVYVLSYDEDEWTSSNVVKDVFVFAGRTYTFTMLWKDNSKTTVISVDGKGIMNCGVLRNGATYNMMTGELKYTFTASDNNAEIVLFNQYEDDRKKKNYSVANPQMYESDSDGNAVENGDVADCDVDFCESEWKQEDWQGNKRLFKVKQSSDWAFLQEVKLGDINGDGSFDIRDLVAAKKSLAGTRSEALNLLSLGYSANATEISAEDLVFIRKLLLGVSVFRSKAQLSSLISELHNSVSDSGANRYAIGYNAAGSTRIAAGIEAFAEKTGKNPSYVDYDMCSLPYINESNEEYLIAQLAKFNRDGGFVALTAHWLVPTQKLSESSNNGAANSKHSLTAQEYAQVYTPGNDIYNNFREELAKEACFIRKLKDLGINVIFRPMHEINIKSFWWCVNSETGVTPEMTVSLYNYVYNYFTTECGLDNIIWQFNADAKADVSSLTSPPNVDMLSIDCYWRDGYYNLSDTYIYLQNIGGDKAVAISEFFSYDDAAYSDLSAYLTKLTNGLTYKFAYLGIYCDLERLSTVTLPDNVLTLSDTAKMCR